MQVRERWRIDADRSTLRFSVPHAVLGEIRGQFGCWGGQVSIDDANPPRAMVRIWVELSSIDTGSPRRDDEIMRTELFEPRLEPALEFDSEFLEIDAAEPVTLTGWIGFHSRRRKMTVDLDRYAVDRDSSGALRFVCTAHASVDRPALGLRRNKDTVDWLDEHLLGGEIDIAAHVEATRDVASAPSLPAMFAALRVAASSAPWT